MANTEYFALQSHSQAPRYSMILWNSMILGVIIRIVLVILLFPLVGSDKHTGQNNVIVVIITDVNIL